MKEVIAICRSEKAGIARTSSVLDRYLWRVGDRTWRGKASSQCLERISKDLRKVATRNMAVALYDSSPAARFRRPLFVVGSRGRFGSDWRCPVSVSRPRPYSAPLTHAARLLEGVVVIAAMFHDFGKATRLFQEKLRSETIESDPVRHEIMSLHTWWHFVRIVGEAGSVASGQAETGNGTGNKTGNGEKLAQWLDAANNEDLMKALDRAFLQGGASCHRLWKEFREEAQDRPAADADVTLLVSGQRDSEGLDFTGGTFAEAVGLLVLSHHRLPPERRPRMHSKPVKLAGLHLWAGSDRKLSREDLCHPEGATPFWHESSWADKFREAVALHGQTLSEIATDNRRDVNKGDMSGAGPSPAMAGLYEYGRLALMLGDHYGSAIKEIPEKPAAAIHRWTEVIANTELTSRCGSRIDLSDEAWKNNAGAIVAGRLPADTLSRHISRVTIHSGKAYRTLLRCQEGFPGLSESSLPPSIMARADTLKAEGRFSWQPAAALKAASIVSRSGRAGFFGCIAAGTGTGKTRGAPMMLASAAMADPESARRRLRFTLGLGLRTLAHQSGREYVGGLGFAPENIGIMIGGPAFDRDAVADESRNLAESGPSAPDLAAMATAGGDRLELAENGQPDLGYENRLDDAYRVVFPSLDDESRESNSLAWLASLSWSPVENSGIPAYFEQIIECDRDSGRHLKLLATPVIAATIDHVMAAADARRGSHLMAMLRVATSDLILDEIDLFDGEDLSAIARLIFLSGAFGRRVIIGSATLTRHVAMPLYRAYCAGWSEYARMHDLGKGRVVHVLAGDDAGDVVAATARTEDERVFERDFDALKSKLRSRIAARPVTRMPTLIRIGDGNPPDGQTGRPGLNGHVVSQSSDKAGNDVWRAIAGHCLAEAALHRISASDRAMPAFCAGLVKLANIRQARRLYSFLRHDSTVETMLAEHGIFLVLACHHARHLWVSRMIQETGLSAILTRKGSADEANRPLEQALVERGFMAKARECGAGTILVLVVSTPVVETGNDLDFDFAVIEPSSTRSIIQTAGRVWRHRGGVPSHPNIGILSRTLRSFGPQPWFAWPGVETPVKDMPGGSPPRISGWDIEHVGWPNLTARPVDARIMMLEDPGELAAAERALLDVYLAGHGDPWSPGCFASHAGRRFSASFPMKRRFRRQTGQSFRLYIGGEGPEGIRWRAKDPHDRRPEGAPFGLVRDRSKKPRSGRIADLFDLGRDRTLQKLTDMRPRFAVDDLTYMQFAGGTDIHLLGGDGPLPEIEFDWQAGFGLT